MLEEILNIDCRKRGRAAPLFLVKKYKKSLTIGTMCRII